MGPLGAGFMGTGHPMEVLSLGTPVAPIDVVVDHPASRGMAFGVACVAFGSLQLAAPGLPVLSIALGKWPFAPGACCGRHL